MNDGQMPVSDDLALRNLVAKYAHYADAGELEKFADLFIDDGSWTRENSPPASQGGSGLPAETFRGREALKTMIENSIIKRFNRKFRHQMTDVLVEAGQSGDIAHIKLRALITDWRDGPGKIAMCGNYTCVAIRADAGWRFQSVSVYVFPD